MNSMAHILLIEDDPGIVDALVTILESEGHETTVLTDGALVESHLRNHMPDIILLDLWVPHISGNELCERIKLEPETKQIPVIVVSANHAAPRIAKQCGADDFLAKPFEMEALLALIAKYT